jgi:hypothetical protein
MKRALKLAAIVLALRGIFRCPTGCADYRAMIASAARLMTGVVLATLVGCSTTPTSEPAGAAAASTGQLPERAAIAVSQATGSALQGDVDSAIAVLERVPESAFVGEAQAFRNCMLARFGAGPPTPSNLGDDPWIGALGNVYLSYWRSALLKPASIEAAENNLAAGVGQLIGRPIATSAELDDAEPEILRTVEAHGFHALLGRTPPLMELMLWKRQTVLDREVDLPGGRQTVKVILLDDFLLRGWGYYATCGRRSAGGWTTDTALFAVVPGYKNLGDEEFSVRFLGHEAQHFADKRAFPGLESWELEYRAKLVELALGTDSQASTLKLFCENRTSSQTAPHGYANAKVIREIAGRVGIDEATLCGGGTLPADAIRVQATQLLEEDTVARHVHADVPASPDRPGPTM